ncbi:MAG TPA: tripartite tricarboxylate transporter substrate binding protein, partial [Burkholderiales bacterium]
MYSTKQLSGWRCVLVALCLASGTAQAADWKPDRNIEIIVPTGPGSGVDNTVRTLQRILQDHKLIDQSIVVTN